MFFLVCFFFYSFIGWVGDTLVRSITVHRYAPGSFFPIPLCPIYGIGALLIVLTQKILVGFPWFVQLVAYGLLLALLEAGSGWFIFHVFHRCLWNYSDPRTGVCRFTDLRHALLWGVLAILVVRYVHPFMTALWLAWT